MPYFSKLLYYTAFAANRYIKRENEIMQKR